MIEFYSVFADSLAELFEDWVAHKHAENSLKYNLKLFDHDML